MPYYLLLSTSPPPWTIPYAYRPPEGQKNGGEKVAKFINAYEGVVTIPAWSKTGKKPFSFHGRISPKLLQVLSHLLLVE
jgi:hypothetical protein